MKMCCKKKQVYESDLVLVILSKFQLVKRIRKQNVTNYTAVLTFLEDCVCFGLDIVHFFLSRSLSNRNTGYQADYHCVNIALPLETSRTYHARPKWLLINLRNTGRIYVSGSLEPVTRTIFTLGYLFQSYT